MGEIGLTRIYQDPSMKITVLDGHWKGTKTMLIKNPHLPQVMIKPLNYSNYCIFLFDIFIVFDQSD